MIEIYTKEDPKPGAKPIMASCVRIPIGEVTDGPDGKPVRVVKQLTSAEVIDASREFYDIIVRRVPPGTEVFWWEVDEAKDC